MGDNVHHLFPRLEDSADDLRPFPRRPDHPAIAAAWVAMCIIGYWLSGEQAVKEIIIAHMRADLADGLAHLVTPEAAEAAFADALAAAQLIAFTSDLKIPKPKHGAEILSINNQEHYEGESS